MLKGARLSNSKGRGAPPALNSRKPMGSGVLSNFHFHHLRLEAITMSYQLIINFTLLIPLAAVIAYYDVRYRRIPNRLVLAALVSGLAVNAIFDGWRGMRASTLGRGFSFVLMPMLNVLRAMRTAHSKLFA